MGNKTERLNLIKRIVGEELIGSQEDLIKRLADHGIQATQSTLSRDFKEINISKMPHPDKGYIYVLSEKIGAEIVTNTANLADPLLTVAKLSALNAKRIEESTQVLIGLFFVLSVQHQVVPQLTTVTGNVQYDFISFVTATEDFF